MLTKTEVEALNRERVLWEGTIPEIVESHKSGVSSGEVLKCIMFRLHEIHVILRNNDTDTAAEKAKKFSMSLIVPEKRIKMPLEVLQDLGFQIVKNNSLNEEIGNFTIEKSLKEGESPLFVAYKLGWLMYQHGVAFDKYESDDKKNTYVEVAR
jgi:hypothetical protein